MDAEVEDYTIFSLMRTATKAEISISEFWEMTPYEMNLVIEAYNERKEERHKESVTLAYVNALWTIQWLGDKKGHPKPLNEILGIKKEKKVMTGEQMLEQVKQLNALFGGNEVTK